jgi:hypothetical protein
MDTRPGRTGGAPARGLKARLKADTAYAYAQGLSARYVLSGFSRTEQRTANRT